MGELAFTQKFKSIIKALGVPYGGENCVYIPQFDAGGMSRGMVSGQFVKKAHSILLHRLDKYRLVKHLEKWKESQAVGGNSRFQSCDFLLL